MAFTTVSVSIDSILQNTGVMVGSFRMKLSSPTFSDTLTNQCLVVPVTWQSTNFTQGTASLNVIPNCEIADGSYYKWEIWQTASPCDKILASGDCVVPPQNCDLIDITDIRPTEGTLKSYASSAKQSAEAAAKSAQEAADILESCTIDIESAGSAQIAAIEETGRVQGGYIESAGSAQIDFIGSAGTVQLGYISSEGAYQVEQVNQTGQTQGGYIVSAGDAQVLRVGSAGDNQVAIIESTGAAQVILVESAGNAQKQILISEGSAQTQAIDLRGDYQIGRINSAGNSYVNQIAASGGYQIDQITSAGGNQVSLVNSAGQAQGGYIVSAGDAQIQAIVASGGYQISLIGSAGDAEIADIQSAGAVYSAGIAANAEAISDLQAEMLTKANVDGYYADMTVGNAEQLLSDDYVTDNEPYVFRTAGGGIDIGNREYDEVVGGTIAWNQLFPQRTISGTAYTGYTLSADGAGAYTITVTDTTATQSSNVNHTSFSALIPNHIFAVLNDNNLIKVSIKNLYLGISNTITKHTGTGSYSNIVFQFTSLPQGTYTFHPLLVDLTAMFGTTIADYIYSLEHATRGAGVAWFKRLFSKDYYAYDAGSLQSVNVSSHDMVGFNAYNPTGGTAILLGGNQYQITGTYSALSYSTGETITPDASGLFTPTADGILTVTGGNSTDTCVHLTWSGYRNGEYEEYEKHSYPLDSSLTLRGIPKLDASNNLYYDGDTYASDGTVTRRYGSIDLGSLTWAVSATENVIYSAIISDMKARAITQGLPHNLICSKYVTAAPTVDYYFNLPAGQIMGTTSSRVGIYDATLYALTPAEMKTALSGVYLVYELATPTTESADPFQSPQIVNDFGTEQYVDYGVSQGTRDVAIPVGHETKYIQNLRDKLRRLPNMPDADGTYLVEYDDRECSFVEYIPPTIPQASDATPQALGTAASGTSADFSRADHVHEIPSQIATNAANITALGIKTDITNHEVDNIQALLKGQLYTEQTDSTVAYTKTVPTGALPWAEMAYVGGETIVWNQLFPLVSTLSTTVSGVTFTANGDGSFSISGTSSVDGNITATVINNGSTLPIQKGHTYLLRASGASSAKVYLISNTYSFIKGNNGGSIYSATNPDYSYGSTWWNIRIEGATVDEVFSEAKVYPQVHDLTLIYGSGNEPSTVAEFEAMFPEAYYAYDSGSLMSAGVTQCVSRDASNNVLGTYPIPAEVKALTGYGWSAGSAYNYVDYERKVFVQNVDRVDLGSISWQSSISGNTYNYFYSSGVSSLIAPPADNSIKANVLCAPYVSVSRSEVPSNTNVVGAATNGNIQVSDATKNPDNMTTSQFRTAMSGVYFYYQLDTPIETDISAYLTDESPFLNVEAEGTLTFENSNGDGYRIPVPSSITYDIDTQAALGE